MLNSKHHLASKPHLDILNQVFEIEKKLKKLQEPNTILRNIATLKSLIANDSPPENKQSLLVRDPLGERYECTRTDCEASIAGTSTDDLVIVEVIKPIIELRVGDTTQIVQKAVVVVQSNNTSN